MLIENIEFQPNNYPTRFDRCKWDQNEYVVIERRSILPRFHGRTLAINTAHSIDDDEKLREFIYRTYFRFESEQEQLLDELLRKRFTRSEHTPSVSHAFV